MLEHMTVSAGYRHCMAHDDADETSLDRIGSDYEASRAFSRLVVALRRYQRDQEIRPRDREAFELGRHYLQTMRNVLVHGTAWDKQSVMALSREELPELRSEDLKVLAPYMASKGVLIEAMERMDRELGQVIEHRAPAEMAKQFEDAFAQLSTWTFEEVERLAHDKGQEADQHDIKR
jgi:hypothetical protein